ncbi:hypothetical protein L2E82_41139 [Cichorium intybus]|uniref:Uncharacterized protein n=1 Tax=Cichorium intybus TaxID=13427 RepID=A0ACB9ALX9_CICIN|nr:hypothetical protein L2E82_41139 [Cichorium intybus]
MKLQQQLSPLVVGTQSVQEEGSQWWRGRFSPMDGGGGIRSPSTVSSPSLFDHRLSTNITTPQQEIDLFPTYILRRLRKSLPPVYILLRDECNNRVSVIEKLKSHTDVIE